MDSPALNSSSGSSVFKSPTQLKPVALVVLLPYTVLTSPKQLLRQLPGRSQPPLVQRGHGAHEAVGARRAHVEGQPRRQVASQLLQALQQLVAVCAWVG